MWKRIRPEKKPSHKKGHSSYSHEDVVIPDLYWVFLATNGPERAARAFRVTLALS